MARDSEERTVEEAKKELWLKTEKELGLPIPEEARSKIENHYLRGISDSADLDDLEGILEEAIVPFAKEAIVQFAKQVTVKTTANLNTILHPPKKRYKKPFEKRIHLVNFVVSRKQGERIDWQRMSDEWNKEYPHEPMSSKVFNAEYHRAKRDNAVQLEHHKRYKNEYPPQIEKLASQVEDNPLAKERLWEKSGKILFYSGKAALSSTADFTLSVIESATIHMVEPSAVVDFSKAEEVPEIYQVQDGVSAVRMVKRNKEAQNERVNTVKGQP